MKMKWIAATLAASAVGVAIAQAPKIDNARIESSVKMYLEQMEQGTGKKPDAKEIAQLKLDIHKGMQQADLLKNLALKEGLDKKPEVATRLINLEARFYASEYVDQLRKNTVVNDADLLASYQDASREMMLQQIAFNSKEDAIKAQSLLLKGMSFSDLAKKQPNPQPFPTEWVSATTQQFAFAANQLRHMVKNETSSEPILSPEDGKYYLLRIADTRISAGAPPFTQLSPEDRLGLKQMAIMDKVQNKLNELYKAHGIEQ